LFIIITYLLWTWIYIAHNILKTSNALITLVKMKQDCLKNCLKLSEPNAGSLSSSGSEFQTVGPAIKNARRPYVLRRQRGTMSWWRFADCRTQTKPKSDVSSGLQL